MGRLVIDPGHGGRDPGAVSRDGLIFEKNINLDVGLYLSHYLERNSNMEIAMTRNDDTFVSLQERCDIANNLNADYFISLHTNARPLRGKYGIELEVWHYAGSTSGERLAKAVLDRLVDDVSEAMRCHSRGTKEGRFYVLRNTRMPAILVEMGFVSDPEEAEWLSLVTSQTLLAGSLGEALILNAT